MRSRLFTPIRNLALSRSGAAAAFIWGAAEALWWPIVPDYYVFGTAAAAPARWWLLALFAAAGSVVGGTVGFWLAFARQNTWPMDFAPLVTEGMINDAGSWLAEFGPIAVLRQPLSGIPYKVFVYLAGAGRLSFLIFLVGSIAARAIRIFAVGAVGAAIGKVAGESRAARYYDLFVILYTALFVYGLWRVVASY